MKTYLPLASLLIISWINISFCSLDTYKLKCHEVFSAACERSFKDIEELSTCINEGKCVPDLGEKADLICNKALEIFNNDAPNPDGDVEKESIFDSKVEDLNKALDTPLQVLYFKQLNLLREKALARYKSGTKGTETNDYEAMSAADSFFTKEAEASTRKGSAWDYIVERQQLLGTMNELAARNKKLVDLQLKVSQNQQNIMQFLQQQQGQIQALQQQLYGNQASPWNLGVAYRIPDTNINLAGSYQQGRTNIQLSCVPDDSAAMLGPNGFTYGVGPGNLGLTVNVNI